MQIDNTPLITRGMRDLNENRAVVNLPINLVTPNPYQPRKEFSTNALEELSASIKEYGVLQPINVRKIGSDMYELISGERRLRASKLAGLKTIPAIINEIVEQDSAVLALIENLQREDLNFMEEAEGYFNLINDHGLTQEELAKKVGKKDKASCGQDAGAPSICTCLVMPLCSPFSISSRSDCRIFCRFVSPWG